MMTLNWKEREREKQTILESQAEATIVTIIYIVGFRGRTNADVEIVAVLHDGGL